MGRGKIAITNYMELEVSRAHDSIKPVGVHNIHNKEISYGREARRLGSVT